MVVTGNSPREALYPSRWVFDETRAKVIRDLAIKHTPQEFFDPHRSLIVSIFVQSVTLFVVPTTISPVQTESITTKPRDLLFWHDKRERDDTTLGFSTLTPLPDPNACELPPITTSTFTARTLENATLTNRASTSNNPDPMISLAFVEANYEVLKFLLRERRRQMHNEDLRTKLEYFSEEYDKEREMEPRPTRAREATPIPQAGSSRVRIQKERVVEFEDAPNREGSKVERNDKGGRPLGQRTEDKRSKG
ncbi:hypothetical protein Tco_0052410 [Tanacetum coccineum]